MIAAPDLFSHQASASSRSAPFLAATTNVYLQTTIMTSGTSAVTCAQTHTHARKCVPLKSVIKVLDEPPIKNNAQFAALPCEEACFAPAIKGCATPPRKCVAQTQIRHTCGKGDVLCCVQSIHAKSLCISILRRAAHKH